MGNVILDLAMSLDGFICGPNDEDGGLHDWYFAPSEDSAQVIDELVTDLGAIIMGRRTYDVGDKQDGFADTPYDAAHVVLTHRIPEKAARGATRFIFVTDGIESALRQAREAAGDKAIAIGGGADISQQFLNAGLVDEIQIHLVHLVLGDGIRLFDHLSGIPLALESQRVVDGRGVTHLKYRVVK